MVKTWSDDNPKGPLMARKRKQLVDAAERIFLENGYAESSVNRIAAEAGVSIKTLYRHFQSKDELFSAVMLATCTSFGTAGEESAEEPEWFSQPMEVGLPLAGTEFLLHWLWPQQLALQRLLIRDALRFPELARRYQDEVVGARNTLFVAYVDRWLPKLGWVVKDKRGASDAFAALLLSGLSGELLLGLREATNQELVERGRLASAQLLRLMESGLL